MKTGRLPQSTTAKNIANFTVNVIAHEEIEPSYYAIEDSKSFKSIKQARYTPKEF